MNRETFKSLLIKHEGLKLFPYKDSVGKTTIGVGRNLDDVGISSMEANYLLDADITRVFNECYDAFPWFNSIDDSRQMVICSMVFNMGLSGIKGFAKMLDAIEKKDFIEAANQMVSSRWATQVGSRAIELATMMHNGD